METKLMVIVLLPAIVAMMTTMARCGGATDDQSPEAVATWFEKLHPSQPPKVSRMTFYLHNIFTGDGITAVPVAQANTTATSPTRFGLVFILDSPLTVGPEFNSELLGYARGQYIFASQEETAAVAVLTLVFTGSQYNGSTVSLLGISAVAKRYREFAIVGGSGDLRLARGIATIQSYSGGGVGAVNETRLFDMNFLHY